MLLVSNSRNPKDFVPRADVITVDAYRKHMLEMFGDSKLPSVIYKGDLYPVRSL